MKIWIVGAQGTCKLEIAKLLENDKFKVGYLFTNISGDTSFYHKDIYKYYSSEDIKSIFENNAYLFINNISESSDDIYEGLDLNEYDNNDIFVLSIDQFIQINTKYINKDDLIVWVDGDQKWRLNNLKDTDYNVSDRERIEKSQYIEFSRIINTLKTAKNILYFMNEEPGRVKTIIKVIVNNPNLKQEFTSNFK